MTTLPDSFFVTKKAATGQNPWKWSAEEVGITIEDIPKTKCQTLHSTATAMGIPETAFLWLMKKEGAAWRHASALKRILAEKNKLMRIKFLAVQN